MLLLILTLHQIESLLRQRPIESKSMLRLSFEWWMAAAQGLDTHRVFCSGHLDTK